ncbi:MAG: TrkA family potassium uptake protein [Bacteroidota bacterium]|jgi:trk system potassium uptake protein TrkA|nr:TrkA family potassium uptake protein [Bacteroidota bacterium]
MKYIIIGLGNFGAPLGEKLTAMGNEVIGVDNHQSKVENLKESLSHTICMDATDEFTMKGLPWKETDIVIVAIGEEQGANIMVTAMLKNFKVNRLISRAINPLHEKVLQAIGVDEIVHPEEETAERLSKKLCLSNVVDSFELNEEYSLIEAKVPKKFIGKTVGSIHWRETYNLQVVTLIKKKEVKSVLGKTRSVSEIQGVISDDWKLEENHILVLYGNNEDLNAFLGKD